MPSDVVWMRLEGSIHRISTGRTKPRLERSCRWTRWAEVFRPRPQPLPCTTRRGRLPLSRPTFRVDQAAAVELKNPKRLSTLLRLAQLPLAHQMVKFTKKSQLLNRPSQQPRSPQSHN